MSSIFLTENALKEIRHAFEEGEFSYDTAYLRVAVVGGGCSGFEYKLNISEEFDEKKDLLEEQDGIRIAIDKRSILYLGGTTVDFYQDLSKRGFVFENPHAVHKCGCGQSFSM
jgi:iron-sulfur cluster assembly protein